MGGLRVRTEQPTSMDGIQSRQGREAARHGREDGPGSSLWGFSVALAIDQDARSPSPRPGATYAGPVPTPQNARQNTLLRLRTRLEG